MIITIRIFKLVREAKEFFGFVMAPELVAACNDNGWFIFVSGRL